MFLVIVLIILSIMLVALILMQPDRSQGIMGTSNILDEVKEPIVKATEFVAIAFLVIAVVFDVIR